MAEKAALKFYEVVITPLYMDLWKLPSFTECQAAVCSLHEGWELYSRSILPVLSEKLSVAEHHVAEASRENDGTVIGMARTNYVRIQAIVEKLEVIQSICGAKAHLKALYDDVIRIRDNGELTVAAYVHAKQDSRRPVTIETDIAEVVSLCQDIISGEATSDEMAAVQAAVLRYLRVEDQQDSDEIYATIREVLEMRFIVEDLNEIWSTVFAFDLSSPIASDGHSVPSFRKGMVSLTVTVDGQLVGRVSGTPVWLGQGRPPRVTWDKRFVLNLTSLPGADNLINIHAAVGSEAFDVEVKASDNDTPVSLAFDMGGARGTMVYTSRSSDPQPTTMVPAGSKSAHPKRIDLVAGEFDLLDPINAFRDIQPAVPVGPRPIGRHRSVSSGISIPSAQPLTLTIPQPDELEDAGPLTLAERVQKHALLQKYTKKRVPQIDQIITGQTPMDWDAVRIKVATFFGPRRPLNPVKVPREPPRETLKRAELVIQVVRVQNMPTRLTGDALRPYVTVECDLGDAIVETSRGSGSNHMWNEALRMAVTPPEEGEGFTAEIASALQSNIIVSVFDDVVFEGEKSIKVRDRVSYHTEPRYLGATVIPASMVVMNGMVRGSFELSVPTAFAGYKLNQSGKTFTKPTVTVLCTFSPMLPFIADDAAKGVGRDSAELIENIDKWSARLEKKAPDRDYGAFGTDIQGYSVFMCRYMAPIAPPPQMAAAHVDLWWDDEGDSRRVDVKKERLMLTRDKVTFFHRASLIRFVASIPFLEDASAFAGSVDLWLQADQFLTIGAGDWEEHALLLAAFLLYFHKDVYIVQANAIPEGDTSYCLVIDNAPWHTKSSETVTGSVINACSGQEYRLDDPMCPITCVHTVFNSSNVWGNVQLTKRAPGKDDECRPCDMNWDLTNTRCWAPLFKTPEAAVKAGHVNPTVQPTALPYAFTHPVTRDPIPEAALHATARELEDTILTRVAADMPRWRADSGGVVSVRASGRNSFRKLLSLMETLMLRGELPNGISIANLLTMAPGEGGELERTGNGTDRARRKKELDVWRPDARKAIARFFEPNERDGDVISGMYGDGATGVILHRSWSDMDSLLVLVRSLRAHEIDPGKRFVHFVPFVRVYPNSVCSVWLWVGNIGLMG